MYHAYYTQTHNVYLSDNLMHSFWANALHSEVFPVPGGPKFRKTLASHLHKIDSNNRNIARQFCDAVQVAHVYCETMLLTQK